ncbi:MHF histone-fold complex component [Entomophthora muscae]|uniref:MHF histone-fold complex component n=2 Tax=Entomophthora muscae TaxID=34485 RepID=A0ACC2RVV5_9FUNG|nr:MHF histone-fold complex component [Entomophthora muscae]KAJ9066791.1 MHF histone-fold complex component [Entomophthora muscae]
MDDSAIFSVTNESLPPTLEDKLRASIWYTVGKICEEEEDTLNATITQQFRTMLAELIYRHAETMASDIEAFAKHGRRSTANAEDIKLCARRNDSIFDIMSEAVSTSNAVASYKEKMDRARKP